MNPLTKLAAVAVLAVSSNLVAAPGSTANTMCIGDDNCGWDYTAFMNFAYEFCYDEGGFPDITGTYCSYDQDGCYEGLFATFYCNQW